MFNLNFLLAKMGFQDPATPIMEGIIQIHNHVSFFLIPILTFVSWWLGKICYSFWYRVDNRFNFGSTGEAGNNTYMNEDLNTIEELSKLKLVHNTTIEIIWTIIPSIILYLIAIPSFLLLYSIDEIINPAITIKIIGSQWYWSYEYSDYTLTDNDIIFDSYMLPDDELEIGQFRLLEVDNPIVLPTNTHVRIIVTASDVLHCWAVPALGVKVDAVPGRLNQGSIFLKRTGIFYGQCSEICGVNHGFMPIVVKSVTSADYINWIISKLES